MGVEDINLDISKAMKVKLPSELPEETEFKEGIRRAPKRELNLSQEEMELALKNALRYVPPELHDELAPEFMEELLTKGRIYGYRYRPQGEIKAKPIDEYEGKTTEGKALQLMIDNNLDFEVALYPYELVTYGETGQVCQNWMQYRFD
jgi:urocanate hydratase